MRGYGLTVFRGVHPERFDVEVIDVIHNFRARMDAVLIRCDHPIINHAATVGGMSGSPIYLDNGRLLGAYAYGWEFGSDPVAAVTPITSMLADMRRPRRTPPGLLPGLGLPIQAIGDAGTSNVPSPRVSEGPLGAPWQQSWAALSDAARVHRERVETPYGALTPVTSPLLVGGLSGRAFAHLSDALDPFGITPVQAGGGGARTPTTDAPTHFENGGALVVPLIQGDISGNVIGTVTYVDGPSLVAFGHPMMGMGETLLPTSIARVMWILANQRRSVKVGEPVRFLGSIVNDRQTGITVDEHATAPMIPVRVQVHGVDGAPHDDWNVRIANHRGLLARLLGTVIEQSLEDTAGDNANLAWTIHSRVALRGRAPAEITELGTSAAGVSGITSLAAIELVGRVSDNAFGFQPVERIDIDVNLRWTRELSYIRSVSLAREELDPGQTAELRVELGRYGATPEIRRIPLEIPRELAGREVEVEVSAGNEAVPDMAEPETLDALVQNLTTRYAEDALVVSFRMPGAGVTVRGRVVPNLPSSALDALRPAVSTDGGEPLANVRRVVVPTGRIVVGRDRVRLRVREVRL